MESNWKRVGKGYYVNRFAGLEVWRGWSGWWQARNTRTGTTAQGRTMREAKTKAYGLL